MPPIFPPGPPSTEPPFTFPPVPNPILFAYGECCGLFKRCSCDDLEKLDDCLDRACAIHDACLGTWSEYWTKQEECNLQLCKNTENCDCSEHEGTQKYYICRIALFELRTFYCNLAIIQGEFNDFVDTVEDTITWVEDTFEDAIEDGRDWIEDMLEDIDQWITDRTPIFYW
jgi:hypothetical protein